MHEVFSMNNWQERLLQIPDGRLLWSQRGRGPLLVFLHGGPGDEHRSLRFLADFLINDYRCVLYDQRGLGGSVVERLDERTLYERTLHPDRFVDDLEALRVHLGAEKLRLVGHFWGAILALLYGVCHPRRVACAALIGLGPLNQEMIELARANRSWPLTAQEREAYTRLSAERQAALEAGDLARVSAINRRRMSQAQPCFINQCGHVPWLEQPQAVVEALRSFLEQSDKDAPSEDRSLP
jgi:pimeloyl-ACP methyl ester carboxylesterase